MRYKWVLEVREVRRKNDLREIGDSHLESSERFIPHMTLVYPFAFRRGVRPFHLMMKVQDVTSTFGRVAFDYAGLASKETHGKEITVFNVNPSEELKSFRAALYAAVRGIILEEPETAAFNRRPKDQFWFHATVSMRSGLSSIQHLKEFFSPTTTVVSEVDRVSLLRSRRIVYEYDKQRNTILTRSEALRRPP